MKPKSLNLFNTTERARPGRGVASAGFEALARLNSGCLIGGVNVGGIDPGAPGPIGAGGLSTDARASVARSALMTGFLISIEVGRRGDPSSRLLAGRAVEDGRAPRFSCHARRDPARRMPGIPQSCFVDGGVALHDALNEASRKHIRCHGERVRTGIGGSPSFARQ